MKTFYQMPYEEVVKQSNSRVTGLSDIDVAKQRETYGSNQLEESKSLSPFIHLLYEL